MAISKTLNIKNIIIEDAYVRAERFTGNKNSVLFYVSIYKDNESSKNLSNAIDTIEFSFVPSEDLTSVRWDKQAYNYLKSLPSFLDAVDC